MNQPDTSSSPGEQQMTDLVAKHRPEIDRIKWMNSKEQMQAFADLGVDPKAVEQHYKGLAERAASLHEQDVAATRNTNLMGWTSAVAGTTATIALKNKIPNTIVRWTVIPITGIVSGVVGTFMGSRLFRGKIREESKQLNFEAKDAFERELAVALENKARGTGPLSSSVPIESIVEDCVVRDDKGHAARVMAEKAAASAEPQRS